MLKSLRLQQVIRTHLEFTRTICTLVRTKQNILKRLKFAITITKLKKLRPIKGLQSIFNYLNSVKNFEKENAETRDYSELTRVLRI